MLHAQFLVAQQNSICQLDAVADVACTAMSTAAPETAGDLEGSVTRQAGPATTAEKELDFANLELADTNVTDFNCYNFDAAYSIAKS